MLTPEYLIQNRVIFEWILNLLKFMFYSCDRVEQSLSFSSCWWDRIFCAWCVYLLAAIYTNTINNLYYKSKKKCSIKRTCSFHQFFFFSESSQKYTQCELCVYSFYLKYIQILFSSFTKLNDAIKIEYNQNLNKLHIGFTWFLLMVWNENLVTAKERKI